MKNMIDIMMLNINQYANTKWERIIPTYHSDLDLHVVKEHQAMFSTFQEALLQAEIPYTPVNINGYLIGYSKQMFFCPDQNMPSLHKNLHAVRRHKHVCCKKI